MYFWRERLEPTAEAFGVDWGITDRHGGSSEPPFASLNLGVRVGDDPEHVRANVAIVAASLGLEPDSLVFMPQVHGASVRVLGRDDAGRPSTLGGGDDLEGGHDALITRDPHLGIAVVVADCTPILLVDRVRGAAGVVHAGRAGMAAGVVGACVRALRELGATDLEALVGPAICARCYEVPEDLRAEVAEVTPVASAVSWTGTPAIDVASAVVAQLSEHDVPLRWLAGCSREHPDLPSHRGGDPVGRYAGVVRLLPPTGAGA